MMSIYQKIIIPENESFVVRKQLMDSRFMIEHSHTNVELTYILSGSGRIIVNDNIFTFESDDIFLLGSNISHSWDIQETNSDSECISVYLREDILLSDFLNVPELNGIYHLIKQAEHGILFKSKNIYKKTRLFEKLITSNPLDSYIAILNIFRLLILDFKHKPINYPLLIGEVTDSDQKQIDKIHKYVTENFKNRIVLADAADLVYMEQSSFCRFFKKITGLTFMEYVKIVRINYAAKLLRETDKQISQICYECGYNNLSNFNYYFKQLMKVTPSEYRELYRLSI